MFSSLSFVCLQCFFLFALIERLRQDKELPSQLPNMTMATTIRADCPAHACLHGASAQGITHRIVLSTYRFKHPVTSIVACHSQKDEPPVSILPQWHHRVSDALGQKVILHHPGNHSVFPSRSLSHFWLSVSSITQHLVAYNELANRLCSWC